MSIFVDFFVLVLNNLVLYLDVFGNFRCNSSHCVLKKKSFRSVAFILEKAMAPHSSTLAWKIPWTEEPGRLQSMGSLRVRHN